MSEHTKDSDCKVNPNTGTCEVCGVYHGDACPFCGGRGFHKPLCREYRSRYKDFTSNHYLIGKRASYHDTTGELSKGDKHTFSGTVTSVREMYESMPYTRITITTDDNKYHIHGIDAAMSKFAVNV